MKKQHTKKYIGNVFAGTSAVVLLLMSALPAFFGAQTVYAGTVSSRSIEMSSSLASATGVEYTVQYTPASSNSIEGVIVDFCSNSPIIGASCTAPTGFSVGTPTVTNYSTSMGTGWTASAESTSTLELSNTTAQTQSTTTPDSFTLTTATNPSTVGSFYARITTYTSAPPTATSSPAYSATAPGTYQDDGGVALSTTSAIDITAVVQETLGFCVYPGTTGSSCGTSPSFTMGTSVDGEIVIGSAAVYTNPVDFSVSTNANHGAAINLEGGTLTSGSNTIPAMTTAGAITAGTADFGLYLSTLGTDVTAASPYTSSSTGYYLDAGTAGSGTESTFGQTIADVSGPVNDSVSTITYGVTASATTPAGIYTATHQLIATATF